MTPTRIPILMYHQIDVPPVRRTPMRGLVVAPRAFRRQMGLLRRLGYRGLSMRDLEPYLNGSREGKVAGLTFDDGYLNNLQNALPVLLACGFTATCYAVSDAIGTRNAWDDAAGVPQKPLMNVAQMREWVTSGMDIGAHSRSHVDLTSLDPEVANAEIAGCKAVLEACLQAEVRHFCYPFGRHTNPHREMVRAAGYLSATTVQRGRADPENDDRYALPRVLVAHATHLGLFWMKLATAYEDRRR